MQNLEPLLIFITVAEMGSFTHAADSLGIQKGRASTAVRKLEEAVGARLLHRTTRSVQLTEDGRVFHARARDLLADVDDLHSMFASDRVALRGRLRVDLPSELARTTIVPALPTFMATYPELELEVSSTDRQVDLVQEGFDCVLRLGPIGWYMVGESLRLLSPCRTQARYRFESALCIERRRSAGRYAGSSGSTRSYGQHVSACGLRRSGIGARGQAAFGFCLSQSTTAPSTGRLGATGR